MVFATVDRARPTRVGDLLMGEPELVDQPPEAMRRLDRIEVLALQVLDERQLEPLLVVEVADDRRDAVQTGRRRRADAPLAGDELVAVEGLRHEDRLEDAVLADAGDERGHLGIAEIAARLLSGSAGCWRGDLDRPAAGLHVVAG